MTKKDAIVKARAGMTAGDLCEILNAAAELVSRNQPSTVNPAFSRRDVWDMMFGAISGYRVDDTVDQAVAVNILREFAQNEPKVDNS